MKKGLKISVIVFPCDLSPQEKCFQYWPSEGSVTFGDYTVELTGDSQCETFTLKDIVLTYRPVRNIIDTQSIAFESIVIMNIWGPSRRMKQFNKMPLYPPSLLAA